MLFKCCKIAVLIQYSTPIMVRGLSVDGPHIHRSAFFQWLMKRTLATVMLTKALAINIHDRSSLKARQARPGPAQQSK